MPDAVHSREEIQALLRPLVGLHVSRPSKGYGSAIFLDLGKLTPVESRHRQHREQGEVCIALEWDWRVEHGTRILFGSSNRGPGIEVGLELFRNTRIQSLEIVGQVPELVVHFSNDCHLRSMASVTGDPQWSVRLPDGTWIYFKKGRFLRGEGEDDIPDEESAALDVAERTAVRWGVPLAEPKRGSCADCRWFVRLDGDGDLLDYGVCVVEVGPFDGRVVHRASGCSLFGTSPEVAAESADDPEDNDSRASEETA